MASMLINHSNDSYMKLIMGGKKKTWKPSIAFGNLYFLLPLFAHFKDGRKWMVKFFSVLWRDWFDTLSLGCVEPR